MRTLECVYRCTQIPDASGYSRPSTQCVHSDLPYNRTDSDARVRWRKKTHTHPTPPLANICTEILRVHIDDIAPVCLLGANELGCLTAARIRRSAAAGRHSELTNHRHVGGGFGRRLTTLRQTGRTHSLEWRCRLTA